MQNQLLSSPEDLQCLCQSLLTYVEVTSSCLAADLSLLREALH